ncbi:alpha/beta hydrolase family protein [Actinokineospora iranica]|uniref:PET hydrolase/cutinase-like domain-containing protein n=1 Tax=Actinokineospora iranica TaxID=1271860 RepID=A0A1G6Q5G2_9PSEU|nr:alpha/beta hydrolase [Actinokineospora iranica]SDC86855.1 hypothetical protein SAMN05216174_10570 [Actinokineospora iranica]
MRFRTPFLAIPALLAIAAGLVAPTSTATAATTSYQRGPNPTEQSVRAANGPFAYSQFAIPDAEATGFGEGTIYYPNNTSVGTFGGVVIAPGFNADQNSTVWLGKRLASHGFVAVTITTHELNDQPYERGKQILAALDYLTGQSPAFVRSRLDPARLAAVGHSMGGGGTLFAAAQRPSLKAIVPLAPWALAKNWSNVQVPTMILSGAQDASAPPAEHAEKFYASLTSAPEKAYAKLDVNHVRFAWEHPLIGKLVVSWLKRFVDEDTRYTQFLCPTATGAVLLEYRATCPLG